MVRRMREMVRAGELGEIRLVQAEYPQDWLTEPDRDDRPASRPNGASIRNARARAARSATSARTPTISPTIVTGLELAELAADLTSFGAGRQLDDNAQIMLRYANGARGAIWASQVAPGNENGLMLRVYGTKGGLAVEAGQSELSLLVAV